MSVLGSRHYTTSVEHVYMLLRTSMPAVQRSSVWNMFTYKCLRGPPLLTQGRSDSWTQSQWVRCCCRSSQSLRDSLLWRCDEKTPLHFECSRQAQQWFPMQTQQGRPILAKWTAWDYETASKLKHITQCYGSPMQYGLTHTLRTNSRQGCLTKKGPSHRVNEALLDCTDLKLLGLPSSSSLSSGVRRGSSLMLEDLTSIAGPPVTWQRKSLSYDTWPLGIKWRVHFIRFIKPRKHV